MRAFFWSILFFVGLAVILFGVPTTRAAFLTLASSDGNIFRTATTFGTPAPTPMIVFESPTGKTIPPNQLATIAISADGLGDVSIDGLQVIVILTGSVPTDITLQAASILGMNTVIQSVTATGPETKVMLVQLSSNPLQPYIAHGQKTLLGTLQFTSPATGNLTVTVDASMSKIIQTATGANILGAQTPSKFLFQ